MHMTVRRNGGALTESLAVSVLTAHRGTHRSVSDPNVSRPRPPSGGGQGLSKPPSLSLSMRKLLTVQAFMLLDGRRPHPEPPLPFRRGPGAGSGRAGRAVLGRAEQGRPEPFRSGPVRSGPVRAGRGGAGLGSGLPGEGPEDALLARLRVWCVCVRACVCVRRARALVTHARARLPTRGHRVRPPTRPALTRKAGPGPDRPYTARHGPARPGRTRPRTPTGLYRRLLESQLGALL